MLPIELCPVLTLDHPLIVEAVRREVVARLDARDLPVTALPPLAFAAVVGQVQYDMFGAPTSARRAAKQAAVARQVLAGIVPTLPTWQAIRAENIALDLAHVA